MSDIWIFLTATIMFCTAARAMESAEPKAMENERDTAAAETERRPVTKEQLLKLYDLSNAQFDLADLLAPGMLLCAAAKARTPAVRTADPWNQRGPAG